jgi:type III secretion protein K
MIESVDAVALADMVLQHPAHFGLLYAFNHRPADYLHASRRARFAAGAGDRLWTDERARAWLSQWILQQLGLSQQTCFDLSCRHWSLALLDAERLLRLARGIGAAIAGPQVRRSVSRDQVLAWKTRLTPALYEFAMTTATLLPPAPAAPPPAAEGTPVEEIGFGWIDAALAGAPEALRLRAELKLPAKVEAVPVDAAAARQFVQSVHSALEPQWCSTFATLAN